MDLYINSMSPPCNAVLLAIKALNLKVNIKEINPPADTRTPEFLKMNPQHTVPTLNDSGFYLWESRAILTYLVNKYGSRDDPLYPKDPKPRALVEQRLYFDAILLYPAFAKCYYPVLFGTETAVNPEDLENAKEKFELLDTLLDSSEFAAIDTYSLADITLLVTVSAFEVCKFDLSPYKRILAWFAKAKESCKGYEEILQANFQTFNDMYAAKVN